MAALLVPIPVAAILSGLPDQVDAPNAALVMVVVVVAVAAGGARSAGVLAALSCAVWFDFFLTVPFQIDDRDDVETAALLLVVGVLVTEVALWGRRQQARSSQREGYLGGVVSAAGMVAEGTAGREAVLDFIGGQIVDVLGIDAATCPAHRSTGRDCIATAA